MPMIKGDDEHLPIAHPILNAYANYQPDRSMVDMALVSEEERYTTCDSWGKHIIRARDHVGNDSAGNDSNEQPEHEARACKPIAA